MAGDPSFPRPQLVARPWAPALKQRVRERFRKRCFTGGNAKTPRGCLSGFCVNGLVALFRNLCESSPFATPVIAILRFKEFLAFASIRSEVQPSRPKPWSRIPVPADGIVCVIVVVGRDLRLQPRAQRSPISSTRKNALDRCPTLTHPLIGVVVGGRSNGSESCIDKLAERLRQHLRSELIENLLALCGAKRLS